LPCCWRFPAHDREFTLERFSEIRELLDTADQLGDDSPGVGRNAPEYRSNDPLRRHLRR
jgi:hypothetical protein